MKKLLVLLLVLSMVVTMFSACSGGDSDDGGASTSSNDSSSSSSSSDSSSSSSSSDTSSSEEWTWPLEEKKELNIWIGWENEFAEDPNELPGIQAIEELTNVHVNWTVVSSAEAAEKFSLMIASGEYPDIIRGAENYYSGGLVKMMDDGVSLELTDYLAEYMPRYSAIRDANPKVMRDTNTDDGRVVAAYTVASHYGDVLGEKIWGGPTIRKDWLDEAGLDVPETIEDWYEALTAIKANHPDCESPLMLANDATDYYGSFISAFGILSEFYVDGDTVKFGPAEPGYKEWLETMRQWYSEGLIDPNFVAVDDSVAYLASLDYIGTGKAAAGPFLWGYTSTVLKDMGYNDEENFELVAAPYPVLNSGDTPLAGAATSELIKESITISSQTEDLELTMRYLDFWYSEEAMMLDSLGIEGESYVDNGDGTFSITDTLKQQVEDGTYPSLSNAVYMYSIGTSDFGLYNWGMFDAIYEGNKATAAYDVWNTSEFDILYPPYATMTDDESQDYAFLYSDIQTLVQENTVKFIMGTQSMDEYDSFVEQLHQFGIDTCIEYKQAAFDRYMAR